MGLLGKVGESSVACVAPQKCRPHAGVVKPNSDWSGSRPKWLSPIVNVLLGVLLQVGELLLVDGGYFGLFLLLLDFHELLFRVLPLREKDVFDPGVNARLANNLVRHVVREYLVVVQKGLVLLLLVLLEHFLLDVLLFKPLV